MSRGTGFAGPQAGGPLGEQEATRSERPWGLIFTSRGRGTGFAGPQAQRPLGGQRITRS